MPNFSARHAASALILVIMAVLALGSSNSTSPPTQSASTTPESAPNPVPGDQWSYDADADPMGKGSMHTAIVRSSNTFEFGFPYAGPQHATLTLRTHPRYGKDVILSLERGQFLCSSYEGCSVLVRFDDAAPQEFSAGGPADNSTEVLFIRNYSRFISQMQKAKRVRISASVYQEGNPVFEFDVSGFDLRRYRPASG